LKYPQLYRDIIEKKMKGDSCRFNTQWLNCADNTQVRKNGAGGNVRG
jgi:hypothetical protein